MSHADHPTVRRVAAFALLLVAAWLLLWGLGDRLLWGDEAETAMLAVSVLDGGAPRVEVEGNRISLYGGADAGPGGLWTWSPWLDEYVAAASIGLLGRRAGPARLPFALAALATVALLGLVVRRAWGRADVALIAMAVLAANVPFLLHGRQCRYYALVMLAQVALIGGFDLAARRRRAGAVVIAAGLVVQGYCNYLALPGNVAGLVAAALVERRRAAGLVTRVAVGVTAGLALVAPWLLWAGSARQAAGLALAGAAGRLGWYVGRIDADVLPLSLLIGLPLVAVVARRTRRGTPPSASSMPRPAVETLLWLLPPAHLLALAPSPLRYFRYLAPLFPVLALLAAVVVVRSLRRPAWRLTALVVLVASNLLSLPGAVVSGRPATPASPLLTFARSIVTPYDDRTAAVVRALDEAGAAGQSVLAADPEFPLMYHARVRVIDARFVRRLSEPPDWILPRSASGVVAGELPVPPAVRANYRSIAIEVPASLRGGGRPDPRRHEWFTATDMETFVLWRRAGAADGRGYPVAY